jgi:hypothetical protein
MADIKFKMKQDVDMASSKIAGLHNSQDLNGTTGSVQSLAINGTVVRILSLDNIIRFEIGENPTAVATGPAIPALGEVYQPITSGHKVAVYGGQANITTVGEDEDE